MATLKEPVRNSSPTSEATRRARGMLGHVVELTELHGQLFLADCKLAQRRALPSVAAMLVAAVVGVSGIPILLGSAVMFLDYATTLSLGGAMLVIGCLALIIAAAIGWYSFSRLARSLESFERSQSEFKLNLAWLKSLLH